MKYLLGLLLTSTAQACVLSTTTEQDQHTVRTSSNPGAPNGEAISSTEQEHMHD
jgi:hypothetical protein